MKKLADYSTQELRTALAEREAAEKKHELELLQAENKRIVENIDTYLAICPEHSRTSCSDANPCNDYDFCARCVLIRAKENGYISDRFRIIVDVSIQETCLIDNDDY